MSEPLFLDVFKRLGADLYENTRKSIFNNKTYGALFGIPVGIIAAHVLPYASKRVNIVITPRLSFYDDAVNDNDNPYVEEGTILSRRANDDKPVFSPAFAWSVAVTIPITYLSYLVGASSLSEAYDSPKPFLLLTVPVLTNTITYLHEKYKDTRRRLIKELREEF